MLSTGEPNQRFLQIIRQHQALGKTSHFINIKAMGHPAFSVCHANQF